MNYLSHGYRFLSDPQFLAGTALPDWLSVVNRRVRVTSKRTRAAQENPPGEADANFQRICEGIQQHHHDDDRFHRCELFMQLEGRLATEFRKNMPDPYDHRPGFLGHIVVELLLDAWLAEQNTTLLDDYYAACDVIPEDSVQSAVNLIASQSTDRLAYFIGRFREAKFLYDYMTDESLLMRVNGVLRRVGLEVLDPINTRALGFGRELLTEHAAALLQYVETPDDE